ncbi:AAA family ATPase [Rhodovarius sp.]|uniref:AAA family ATPase n=1 Tax=Rhodovarius sp. TaxID=2972673 RepID=UPI00333FB6F7
MSEDQQRLIRESSEAGVRPNRQASGRISLPLGGNRYIILGDGKAITEAGQFWKSVAGEGRGLHGLGADDIQRSGNREYLYPRGGKRQLLRTIDERTGDWNYTRAGTAYFSKHEFSEWVVHVPVRIQTYGEGHRQQGRMRQDYIPYTKFSQNIMHSQLGTEQSRIAAVKAQVRETLGITHDSDIIGQMSDESYAYDDSRPWSLTEMSTKLTDGRLVTRVSTHGQMTTRIGNATQTVRSNFSSMPRHMSQMDVPAGHRGQASFLPFPDDVLPEAFETHPDRLCVPRQLAVLLRISFEYLCSDFDLLLGGSGWRDVGISCNQIMLYLKDKGIPYHCWADDKHHVWTPAEAQADRVAWTFHDRRVFMYKSGRALEKHRPHAGERAVLKAEHQGETPPFSAWGEWQGELAPGHFYCSDLRKVRQELLERGKNPKVSLKSLCTWAALRYRCTMAAEGVSGWCVIKEVPQDFELMKAWCEKLGVEYRGQGLPSLTLEVFQHLLGPKRKQPTLAERRSIVARQGGRCALCSEEADLEMDHDPPLRELVIGQPQVFRGLCKPCHQEVSASQGSSVRLESRFSPQAWRDYVTTARPPPLIWQPEKAGSEEVSCEVDVIRCRMHALKYPAVKEWPVFCALDSSKPQVAGELCDFSFVTGVRDHRKSRLSLLPWVGQMWYARPAVEFMLHHGIIEWQHISHGFQATGRVAVNFVSVLEKMEDAWCPEARALFLPKSSVNQMIGVWAINPTCEALSVVSGGPADGEGSWASQLFSYGDCTVNDWIHRVALLDNSSWRPIHDIIMATEHAAVAHMRYVIARLEVPCAFLDVKTDALNLEVSSKHLPRIKKAVEGVRFQDLHGLAREKGQKRLRDGSSLCPRKSDQPVFRFREEGKRLKGVYREPQRDVEPPATDSLEWTDLSEPEARQRIMEGRSIMIEGLPGTGKSFWVAQLCKEMEEAGRVVAVISKTHAQVANFNAHLAHHACQLRAMTADHWANAFVKRGRAPYDCVVVEEASMIDCRLWNEIAKASLAVGQWILIADWNQFEPIQDTWCGGPIGAKAQHSQLLRALSQGHRWTPTVNQRSDPVLFDFIQQVVQDQAGLDEARAQFPLRPGPCRYSLSISHRTRMRVNRQANEAAKPPDAVRYVAPPCRGDNAPQSMWVYVGQELIGAGGRAKKGLFYTVTACSAEKITVAGHGEPLTMTAPTAVKCLRLSHCLTYASCQGLSLDGVRLLDTSSVHFGKKHLYVGASRCTSSDTLQVS